MKAENKAYLNRFRHHRQTQLAAQFIGQIQMEERKELLRIAREEFDPNYRACITCPEDLYQLVAYVYGQEEQQAAAEQPQTIRMTFPKQEPENEEAKFLSEAISSEPPSESNTAALQPPKQAKSTSNRKRN